MLRADDLAPGDLFHTVWRHRFMAVVAAIVCAAFAYGYSLFVPDLFVASTLVLVEDAGLPAGYARSTATLNLGERLNTLSERILNRTRLDQLMQESALFGNPRDPLEREAMLAKTRQRITLDVSGTEAFRISFKHEDPSVAAQVANALAAFFIRDSEQAVERQVEDTTSGLQAQLESVRLQLAGKEGEIRDFKTANLGMLPEQMSSNMQTITRLQQGLSAIAERLDAARNLRLELESQVPATQEAGVDISARAQARVLLSSGSSVDLQTRIASHPPRVRLEALRLQRDALLGRWTSRHPDVQMLEADIAALERQVARLPAASAAAGNENPAAATSGTDPRLAAVRRDIRTLESQRAEAQGQLDATRLLVVGAPLVEERLRRLGREHDALLRNYEGLFNKNSEAELAGSLQGTGPSASFRIVDAAVIPQRPSSPMRILFLLGGGFVGLGLVFAGAVLREMALEPLYDADEVEKYAEIPVLASIPFIETGESRRRLQIQRWVSAATVVGALVVVVLLRLMLRP